MGKYLDGKVYVWGTGVRANEFNKFHSTELEMIGVDGYIDNDKDKWGKKFWNKMIFSPDILETDGKKFVYIANQYEKEIKKQLEEQYKGKYELLEEEVFLRMQMLLRYEKEKDSEIAVIMDRLKNKPLEVFNYDFVEKYDVSDSEIFYDEVKGLYYVLYHGKKMYFSKVYDTVSKVKAYYKSILVEQDVNSPHLYLTSEFDVQNDAVVIDAGVAEGNFSLSIIDKVSKIYMFEPDQDWIKALQYTFEPYKDKIVIISKCLSNYINDVTTTIDSEIDEQINFIKMDIEGEEFYSLLGAKRTIAASEDLKCVICTYHQEFAYEAITQLLEKHDIEYETSAGYMWYPDGKMRPPILRRGVVRGCKKTKG